MLHQKLAKHRWISREEVAFFIRTLAQSSLLVSGTTDVAVCRDPGDNRFLAAAIEGKAPWVVSGGKDLIAVKSCKTVSVVRPTAFLRELKPSSET